MNFRYPMRRLYCTMRTITQNNGQELFFKKNNQFNHNKLSNTRLVYLGSPRTAIAYSSVYPASLHASVTPLRQDSKIKLLYSIDKKEKAVGVLSPTRRPINSSRYVQSSTLVFSLPPPLEHYIQLLIRLLTPAFTSLHTSSWPYRNRAATAPAKRAMPAPWVRLTAPLGRGTVPLPVGRGAALGAVPAGGGGQ